MLIGYMRVSTDDQDLSLQRDALLQTGVSPDRLYEDTASGALRERPGLEQALKACRPGDTLVVWRLDRLARSLRDLIDLSDQLERGSISLRSLHENIDTSTASGKLFFHIMGALAEFERNLIRERTRAGLEAARRRGRKPGRKKRLGKRELSIARILLAEGKLTIREIAEHLGISTATFYRYFPGGRRALSFQDDAEKPNG